ncbi:ABC transporter substrate-binding protein [Pelagibacterium limicola]|uniref:ABC transporter substrate-binding protein n=1 Tax=Pelagibacterium limicola TaxID=2791022 RepID=UPI0018AFA1C1|nr:ABC transporter substrate-binding protein [Pelagibacterium limicola]
MRLKSLAASSALGLLAGALFSGSAFAQQITVYCGDNDCDTMRMIADRFEAEHPGMSINFELVSYQAILEALPVQLESGEGPDAAVVTDLGGLSRYYLDISEYVDSDFFEDEFGGTLIWLRGANPGSDAINGMPFTLTVNGGYVNLTLFEQAGVPLPEEGATWDEWAEATSQVAAATGTEFAMSMDRSGHRFASLAISHGAELVDEEGNPVVDEGLRLAVEKFVDWHQTGVMPMDLWGAVGGATHRELFSDFLNANVVMYFGGSWALWQMDAEVGDLFDWKVIDAPCGPGSCTVMPGGGALVGFAHTRHPEVVGAWIGYLAQPENMREVVSTLVEIPAGRTLVEDGVDYPTASERTQEALATFTNQIPKMAPAAYRFQGWRFQRAMMNALTTRISQVLNNELSIDAALDRIAQDVNLAIEAAAGT